MAVDLGLAEPLASLVREHAIDLRGSTSRFVKEEMQFARACPLLIGGQAARAAELLEPLARNSILLRRHHVLGRAYEAAGRFADAAAEYEEVLKYPYRKTYLVNPAVWVLDQFRRARSSYEKFLTDWKDADPEIPEVIQAKERLAALGGGKAEGVKSPAPAAR